MTTGQRIKAARKIAGITQADLAEKLNIPFQSISQWERDIRKPKLETLEKLSKALDVSIAYLLGRVSHPLDYAEHGISPAAWEAANWDNIEQALIYQEVLDEEERYTNILTEEATERLSEEGDLYGFKCFIEKSGFRIEVEKGEYRIFGGNKSLRISIKNFDNFVSLCTSVINLLLQNLIDNPPKDH